MGFHLPHEPTTNQPILFYFILSYFININTEATYLPTYLSTYSKLIILHTLTFSVIIIHPLNPTFLTLHAHYCLADFINIETQGRIRAASL
ncbi:hypothetical protein EYC80_005979 [Monilinia laxa]|uniref:Uncharacterized protein n=1 Tax=Monilinia laxa TaxID=61186 RepID=A0A5N6KFY7_MONLA|nr:hypothetical protein EYC80_005979 [Monilinia laxa]